MSNLKKDKISGIRIGHRMNMKFQMPINILKKNQKRMEPNKFKEHVGIWIGDLTPVDLGRVLDKYVREHDAEPKLIKVTGWFTVKISNCQGLANSSIMLALKYAMMPLPVQVYDFKRIGGTNCATGQFFVDNKLIANRMKRLNGKVSVLYSNQIIDIQVETGLPACWTAVQPQAELLAAVKAALHARYDRITQTLDLSRFHATTQMLAHFCPLHAVPAMRFLLELIWQEFLQLRVLQLRDNFLCTLSAFQGFSHSHLPGLQELDIGANNLSDPFDLKHLKDLNLKTLNITNNPLAKCRLGQLRNVLPQVLIISNGRNNSAVKEESILTMPQKPHELPDFCMKFAQCYYKIFNDIGSRKELEMFYSDAATFTLNASQQQIESNNDRSYSRFGLSAVMKAICQLPEIHVDINDAKLEVQTFNSKLRMFTLRGSCRLLSGASQTSWKCRKYVRQFVMRSAEMSRWLITNDMLTFYPSGKEEKNSVPEDVNNKSKLEVQLEDLNNNMPKLTLQPEKSTQSVATKSLCELPSFKEQPAHVPISSIEIHTSLEQQVDDTFLCSDDEVFLVINEEDLMDSVEL